MNEQAIVVKMAKKIPVLLISSVVLFLITILIWGTASDWGSVTIKRVNLVGDDGLKFSTLMYIPKSATDKTPAPAVMVFHGGTSLAHRFDYWAIEFARRGYVVANCDLPGSGYSDFSNKTGDKLDEKYCDFLVKYINSMPIVEKNKIAAVGHSAGTGNVTYLCQKYPDIMIAGGIIHGNAQLKAWHTNLFFVYNDGDYTNNVVYNVQWKGWEEYFGFHFGLKLPTNEKLYNVVGATSKTYREMVNHAPSTLPENDVIYGSFADKTARMLHFETARGIHTSAGFSSEVTTAMLRFIGQAAPTSTRLSTTDFIWQWNAILGLLGMIAFIVFLTQFANSLLKTPYFAGIKQPINDVGVKKGRWFRSAAISMVGGMVICLLACTYIPRIDANWLLMSEKFNRLGRFLVCFAIFDIILFFVLYYYKKIKAGEGKLSRYGLAWERDNAKNIGKSLLLSLTITAAAFLILNITEYAFGVNYQFLLASFNGVGFKRAANSYGMIILFLLVFFAGNLGANITRRLPVTGNPKRDMALSITANVITTAMPFALLCIAQIIAASCFGYVIWESTYIDKSYGFPFIVAGAAALHTYIFRKTGSVWPGIFTASIFVGIVAMSNYPFELMIF